MGIEITANKLHRCTHLELGDLSLIEHGEDIGSRSLGALLCGAATCCCLS